MNKPFTKMIANLNLISLTVIILVLTAIFTIVYSIADSEHYEQQLETLRSTVYQSKKDLVKNIVYRTISDIEKERELCSDYVKMISKSVKPENQKSHTAICSDDQVKERMKDRIRSTKLIDDGYIWINKVINYDGGKDYAIRLVHPNLVQTEGLLLSTEMTDIKGNTPYLTELEGVKKTGELFFEYWFKKKNSSKISHKLTFAKLYKDYDWIICTGVYLDDIKMLIQSEKAKLDAVYKKHVAKIIITGILTALLTLVVAIVFQRKIRKTIDQYIFEAETKEQENLDINLELENRVQLRTKEIKESEMRVKKSEKYLRDIYDAAENVAFVVTDLAGEETKILDLSPGAEKIFGYTRGEAIGEKVSILHPPETIDNFSGIQPKLLKEKVGFSGEAVLVRKNGEKFPALFNIFPKLNNEGKVEGTIGVSIDITKRKQEEERYKQTIEISIDGFWVVDIEGRLIEVNDAYCKMVGYTRGELLDMTIADIDAILTQEDIKRRIEEVILKGSGRFETKQRHKNNYLVDVEVSTTYSKDSGGMFFVFLRDITERKKLETQIQQTQKMETIGTLAGGIAHDFNNILYPIIGHTEMMLEDIPEESPLRYNLEEIFTSALRAKELVKQILTFSRQERCELILMKIQPIIQEALNLIRSTIPSTISIEKDIQADCGYIEADPTQIHQVVMNLSTNAFHSMEVNGGRLTVRLKEVELGSSDLISQGMAAGRYACLTVSDQGIGMDDKLKEKIFNPFFTTKGEGKGTGLGLSVVHGIVISLKGGVQIYSNPGRGTTMLVYIPIKKSENESEQKPEDIPEGGTEHLLIVDDEDDILRLQKKILRQLGYTVTSCNGSLEALEMFFNRPHLFDLVITDLAMPNMTGDKLASEMLKIRPDIPIILNTGFSDQITPERVNSIGIKAFLMKPVIKNEFVKTVRDVLGKPKNNNV